MLFALFNSKGTRYLGQLFAFRPYYSITPDDLRRLHAIGISVLEQIVFSLEYYPFNNINEIITKQHRMCTLLDTSPKK